MQGCASLICIGLCNLKAWRSSQPTGRSFLTSPACLEVLSKNSIRFVATAWIVASGLVLAFTVARHPPCLMSARAKLYSPAIDVGTQCIVQRAGVAASLLAMYGLSCLTCECDRVLLTGIGWCPTDSSCLLGEVPTHTAPTYWESPNRQHFSH